MARPKRIETPVEKVQRIRTLVLVRAVRNALGLSQRELSRILGIHFSTLARFESGHNRLKFDHIQSIFGYFKQAGVVFDGIDKGDLHIHMRGESASTTSPASGMNAIRTIKNHASGSDISIRYSLNRKSSI